MSSPYERWATPHYETWDDDEIEADYHAKRRRVERLRRLDKRVHDETLRAELLMLYAERRVAARERGRRG